MLLIVGASKRSFHLIGSLREDNELEIAMERFSGADRTLCVQEFYKNSDGRLLHGESSAIVMICVT